MTRDWISHRLAQYNFFAAITMIVWMANVSVFASKAMVSCQMLSELEEVIQYKLVPERRDIIRETWWERLQVTAGDDIWTHTYSCSLTCSF